MQDFLMWAGGIAIGGIFSLIGWVYKMLSTRIEKNHEDLHDLEANFAKHMLYASEKYATKKDMNAGFDRVMDKLDKIDDKLDKKADK